MHHQLNGHEFEKILADGEGPGSLECCSSRGLRESNMTEQLNSNIRQDIDFPENQFDGIIILNFYLFLYSL